MIDYLSGRMNERPMAGQEFAGADHGGRGEDSSVDLIHETLIRAKGKDVASGKLVGHWKTLYDYIENNRERGFYREQLTRQAQDWLGRRGVQRWFRAGGVGGCVITASCVRGGGRRRRGFCGAVGRWAG
ncbi:MAG: hypothetical protein R3E89_15290 [Thiolinea sp.]